MLYDERFNHVSSYKKFAVYNACEHLTYDGDYNEFEHIALHYVNRTYDRRASSFLHVHRTRAHSVLVHHAFGIEVGESRSFLHIRQRGRAMQPEPAVLSTSAPTVGEHL